MPKGKFGDFKYKVGEIIKDDKRQLEIIDTFYIPKQKHKNGKPFISNEKWYKYKCLKCGNVDTIIEDSLYSGKCGCNACCTPPKKIVKGINDISTTAPWMMQYIVDEEYIYNNSKYSKNKTTMKCPDCGRVYIKSAMQVCANHGLTCACKDSWSYPNKYIYSLLEQLGVDFEPEKIFEWSDNRRYDIYLNHNGIDIIVEMFGLQHYKEIYLNKIGRSFDDEVENDVMKKSIAEENGIKHYFIIDSSVSESLFIKQSIIDSGLLQLLNVSEQDIDWDECDCFATSNLHKSICEYHESNPCDNLESLAKHFRVSKRTIRDAIEKGLKNGWCSKSPTETHNIRVKNGMVNRGQKPIYCITNDMYFSCASIACNILSNIDGTEYSSRPLRKSIDRNQRYKNYKFKFISREEFNKAKSEFPDKCFGNFFVLREDKHD